jgi:DNA-binding CsgD family transcriptional regulator
MPNSHDLICDLYNSVLDNSLWTAVINRIMKKVGAEQCLPLCPVIESAANIYHPAGCQAYEDSCPLYKAFDWRNDDAWTHNDNSITRYPLRYSEVSEGFSKHVKAEERKCAFLFDDGVSDLVSNPTAYLKHDSIPDTNDAGIQTADFIRDMLPHLQCALRIRWQIIEQHQASTLREKALDQILQAMALLDDRGKILFANRRAENIFREGSGPVIVNQHLSAHNAEDANRLQAALRQAVQGVGTSVRLENSQWIATFSPLPAPGASMQAIHTTRILVLIANPDRIPKEALPHFAKLYGLTPTETRVLEHLLGQQSTQSIAETLGISIKTLRVHLGNLFAKTSTTSQRELVRFFLAHPATDPL